MFETVVPLILGHGIVRLLLDVVIDNSTSLERLRLECEDIRTQVQQQQQDQHSTTASDTQHDSPPSYDNVQHTDDDDDDDAVTHRHNCSSSLAQCLAAETEAAEPANFTPHRTPLDTDDHDLLSSAVDTVNLSDDHLLGSDHGAKTPSLKTENHHNPSSTQKRCYGDLHSDPEPTQKCSDPQLMPSTQKPCYSDLHCDPTLARKYDDLSLVPSTQKLWYGDLHNDPALTRKRSDPSLTPWNGRDTTGVLFPESIAELETLAIFNTGPLVSFDNVEQHSEAHNIGSSTNHLEAMQPISDQKVSEAVERDLLSRSEATPTATSSILVSEADADLISQLDDVLASYIDGSSAAV